MLRAEPLKKGARVSGQKKKKRRGPRGLTIEGGDEVKKHQKKKTLHFLFMTRSSCVCDVGWTGPECEAELGGCISMPCAHGGTCQPQPSGYNCTCPPGYTGEALPKPQTFWAGHPLIKVKTSRDMSQDSGSGSPPRRTGHRL